MNWIGLRDYLVARLVERGTWLGLIALAGLLGYAVDPAKIEIIIMVGTGLGAALMVLFADPKPVQNVTVNPTISIAAGEPTMTIKAALTPPKPGASPAGTL